MENMMNLIKLSYSVLLLCSTLFAFDLDGVTVVHRIDNKSQLEDGTFRVRTEVHFTSRFLGKLLLDAKGQIIDTVHQKTKNVSYRASSISFEGRWDTRKLIYQDKKGTEVTTYDLRSRFCDDGKCAGTCENSPTPRCSCPAGYILNQNDSCFASYGKCSYIFSAVNEGRFTTPNFPNTYPNSVNCTWLINAPIGAKIKLNISSLRTEIRYDKMEIIDVNDKLQLALLHGDIGQRTVLSNGNKLMIQFISDTSNTYRGGEIFYSINTPTGLDALQLLDDSGSVILKQVPIYDVICLSVIYRLSIPGTIDIQIDKNEEENFKLIESGRYEEGDWNISRFILPEYYAESADFTVSMTGKNSILYRFFQCDNSYEADIYSDEGGDFESGVRSTSNLVNLGELINFNLSSPCYNGGTMNGSNCKCPIGFTGEKCERACGLNRYGNGCENECSGFVEGCKNMIFCKSLEYPKFCSCASGLTGRYCDEECSFGFYGVNCLLRCGRCTPGTCDPYTGKCHEGCDNGYHPPYCQESSLYPKYAPSVINTSWNKVTIGTNLTELLGKGIPFLYQVQYQEENENWMEMPPQEIIFNFSRSSILDLKPGTNYSVRVVIIGKDGSSYLGHDVPRIEFTTLCSAPDESNFEINITDITASSFSVKWKYEVPNRKLCPVIGYKVTTVERWRNISEVISSSGSLLATIYNLLPGHQYRVQLCAVGKTDILFCSRKRKVNTAWAVPQEVTDLHAYSRDGKLIVSWDRSHLKDHTIIGFKLHYQCVKQLLCEDSCEESVGMVETSYSSVQLDNLIPVAQYRIRVAAYSSKEGHYSQILITTETAKPTTSPRLVSQPILLKTNTSASITWDSPSCVGLNGNLLGYFYRFYNMDPEEKNKPIKNGTIQNNKVTFSDLLPLTNYLLEVHAVNLHGWNADYNLPINFITRGTVPEAVEDLIIYKSGRRMLGIRWALPTKMYGILKSFMLIYHDEVSKKVHNVTLDSTPCSLWSNMYCHTIYNLRPEKNYTISVSARNTEINEDGQIREISGYTRENAPSAPTYLKISNSTPTSLILHWGLPAMMNGELRSFLVNVEHIASWNDDECCEYFPVHEVPMTVEEPSYNLKVSKLIPASTYIISVTAKTITLGPSINITYRSAPLPPVNIPRPLLMAGDDNSSYNVKIQPMEVDENIECYYLLLVLSNHERISANISYIELKQKLSEVVKQNFYIVSEFTNGELLDGKEVTIGTGGNDTMGLTGVLKNPKLTPGLYQVGLAVVLMYVDAFSIGFIAGDAFEIQADISK